MSVDFEHLHKSLRRARRKLLQQPSKQVIVATLQARSRAVASREADGKEREELGSFVVVVRGDVRLALPMNAVDELRWVTLSALPYSNEVVNGLLQLRGRTHSLVDVAPILAIPHSPLQHGERALVVLVTGSVGTVGLRLDDVVGPRQVTVDEVDRDFDGGTVNFVSHVLLDRTMVIDVEALLSDPAIRLRRQR